MKRIIRKEILTMRKAESQEAIEKKSNQILEKLLSHPAYEKADMVLAYIDAKGEVCTKNLIEKSWVMGKTVAVPRVHGEEMDFYIISSYEDLECGSFGIMEPKESCVKVSGLSKNTLVIMPGVAFDREGNRIGYGKGYYDKYFTKYPELTKIALAFEFQIVPEIEADAHDIKADFVITEK